MPGSRFVFVEGIIGAGKSTTAARIAEHLTARGTQVRRVNEGDERLRLGAQLAHGYTPWLDLSTHQYVDRCRRSWEAFVSTERETGAVTVSDGLLFHGNLTDLVMMDADAATIASYYETVLTALAPLRPCLVHLRVHDVARTVHAICVERGAAWQTRQVNWKVASPFGRARRLSGVDGLVRLYEEFARTCDSLVLSRDLPTLRVDDARPWPERERITFAWIDETV